MFSIIIPAHNEEKLLKQTLMHLLDGGGIRNVELIVVCNGCSDNTFAVAEEVKLLSRASLDVNNVSFKIINETHASKIKAINLGLSKAQYEHVVLLDADIKISGKQLSRLVDLVDGTNILLASPKVSFDFDSCSWIVKQYYKTATLSAYNQCSRLSNVIVLSPSAKTRLGQLPDVIADDEYIRRQFKLHEYKIFDDYQFVFLCPRTPRDLMNVLTRVERGNIQLKQLGVKNTGTKTPNNVNKPSILSLGIFYIIKIIVKLRARIEWVTGRNVVWHRDESNRI